MGIAQINAASDPPMSSVTQASPFNTHRLPGTTLTVQDHHKHTDLNAQGKGVNQSVRHSILQVQAGYQEGGDPQNSSCSGHPIPLIFYTVTILMMAHLAMK